MENRVIFSLEDQILLSYNPPQSHDLEIEAKPIGFNKDRDTPGLDFLPFFWRKNDVRWANAKAD